MATRKTTEVVVDEELVFDGNTDRKVNRGYVNANGRSSGLGSLWLRQPAVIVFLRHYG